MKASILDLRRQMSDVLKSLEHNEPVTILHRGKEKSRVISGRLCRFATRRGNRPSGLWNVEESAELSDVGQNVRRLRKGRFDAI